MFDAVFCMGGGYYPRFVALDRHLRGDLPDDYDSLNFHQIPGVRPIIERGSAAMAALLEADGKTRTAPTSAPLITGVDFVAVPARDFDASVHFYGTVLGLPFVKRWGDMPCAEFQAGSLTIAVLEPSAFGQEFRPHAVPIALQVDDVDAARRQLEAQGVEFVGDLIDSGVCHQAIFLDPAGNALDLHHRYAPNSD
jgi:predicted enzyme related to lactoylglutathione lyase